MHSSSLPKPRTLTASNSYTSSGVEARTMRSSGGAYVRGSPKLRRPRHPFSAEMTCRALRSDGTFMRRDTSENQHDCSACHGAATRVEVHRSRFELERVLSNYGAHEVLFVEADANASIQFAIRGQYVQLALPLPDPDSARFTHTASGRRRTLAAQERAYEQALRAHWRSLVVAVRGKLQSVESGISTFEHEFEPFLVARVQEERKKRNRRAPKAVGWLLGGSHTLAIGLVAAFLVPASAVGAF